MRLLDFVLRSLGMIIVLRSLGGIGSCGVQPLNSSATYSVKTLQVPRTNATYKAKLLHEHYPRELARANRLDIRTITSENTTYTLLHSKALMKR